MLGGNEELAAGLGAALWPRLAAAYVAARLAPARPTSEGEVEAFSRRAGLGARLEGKAQKLGLLPGTGWGVCGGGGGEGRGGLEGLRR